MFENSRGGSIAQMESQHIDTNKFVRLSFVERLSSSITGHLLKCTRPAEPIFDAGKIILYRELEDCCIVSLIQSVLIYSDSHLRRHLQVLWIIVKRVKLLPSGRKESSPMSQHLCVCVCVCV